MFNQKDGITGSPNFVLTIELAKYHCTQCSIISEQCWLTSGSLAALVVSSSMTTAAKKTSLSTIVLGDDVTFNRIFARSLGDFYKK